MKMPRSTSNVKNILLDINGVLYDSGRDDPIDSSVEAMEILTENGYKFCLVTNECTTPKRLLARKLQDMGFHMVSPDKIVSPAPVASRYIIDNKLIPRLHTWDAIEEDFLPALEDAARRCGMSMHSLSCLTAGNTEYDIRPNCIVVGDVMSRLDQNFMDESLAVMLESPVKPEVIAMGGGRYYKDADKIRMDTGAYAAAFCYALGIDKPTCIGKPSAEFFKLALDVVGGTPDDTIMIGDDIVSDVGGAQAMGMRGYLVRTGKYKPSDETDRGVVADGVYANLMEIVEKMLMVN